MNRYAVPSQADVAEVDVRTAPLRAPDSASSAEMALEHALRYCAEKLGVGVNQGVKESVRRGEPTCRSYFDFALAREIADYLGAFDEDVRAAYIFEYEATPEDICFCEENGDPMVHLIVQVRRRTAALQSMLQALESALIRSYASLLDATETTHLLDVQIVDEEDISRRRGYGALLSSLHHRPLQVWERGGSVA
jgi:hypothetical protein